MRATDEEFARIARIVKQLDRPVRPRELAMDLGGPAPFAAIVSDDTDDWQSVCSRLSGASPVILVADQTSFDFRLAALRAGASALVRRPTHAAEFAEWFALFASRTSPASTTVLIVDDDRLASTINAQILRSAGMVVGIATGAAEALRAIEEGAPDIVLMDLGMPGVDGMELAQIIRQSMRLASLPLIFLSAERDEARQLVARQHGGDDFITKPVHPGRLVSLVRMRADRSRFLRSLIERDRLTGLLNHARFNERLDHELERCRRSGTEVTLATIDIDRFKNVNDDHGHSAGDVVLRALADLFSATLRKIDIAGRLGGEEFGLLLLDTGVKEADVVLRALGKRFSASTFQSDRGPFSVTFSAGLASSRSFAQRSDLSAAADGALYAAKRAGRDRVLIAGDPAAPAD